MVYRVVNYDEYNSGKADDIELEFPLKVIIFP
jgi:hypothetical protein